MLETYNNDSTKLNPLKPGTETNNNDSTKLNPLTPRIQRHQRAISEKNDLFSVRNFGTCIWFDAVRGVGEINCGSRDLGAVKVERAQISAVKFPALKTGERVEFVLDFERRENFSDFKWLATNVTSVGGKPVQGVTAPRCRWNPHDTSHHAWDVLILLIILYNIVAVPFTIAFNVEVDICDFWNFGWFFYFNLLLDLLFMVDIVVNFLTPIVEPETHQLNWELKAIAQNYAKFWLYIDVVSSIPWDLIIEVVS